MLIADQAIINGLATLATECEYVWLGVMITGNGCDFWALTFNQKNKII